MSRDHEHGWMMFAAASLAAGKSAKEAVDNADKTLEAAKSRFSHPEDRDIEDDD